MIKHNKSYYFSYSELESFLKEGNIEPLYMEMDSDEGQLVYLETLLEVINPSNTLRETVGDFAFFHGLFEVYLNYDKSKKSIRSQYTGLIFKTTYDSEVNGESLPAGETFEIIDTCYLTENFKSNSDTYNLLSNIESDSDSIFYLKFYQGMPFYHSEQSLLESCNVYFSNKIVHKIKNRIIDYKIQNFFKNNSFLINNITETIIDTKVFTEYLEITNKPVETVERLVAYNLIKEIAIIDHLVFDNKFMGFNEYPVSGLFSIEIDSDTRNSLLFIPIKPYAKQGEKHKNGFTLNFEQYEPFLRINEIKNDFFDFLERDYEKITDITNMNDDGQRLITKYLRDYLVDGFLLQDFIGLLVNKSISITKELLAKLNDELNLLNLPSIENVVNNFNIKSNTSEKFEIKATQIKRNNNDLIDSLLKILIHKRHSDNLFFIREALLAMKKSGNQLNTNDGFNSLSRFLNLKTPDFIIDRLPDGYITKHGHFNKENLKTTFNRIEKELKKKKH